MEIHEHNHHNEGGKKKWNTHSHAYEVKFHLWILIISSILLIYALLNVFGAIPDYNYSQWVEFSLATIIILILGYDYLYTAIMALKSKTLSVNLLVSISLFSAYIYSSIMIIFYPTSDSILFFDATIEIATIIYYGKYLENYLSKKVVNDLNNLLDIYQKEVIILKDNKEIKISPDILKKDDLVVIYPGEKIPTDGIIIEGESLIDESTFTGEKLPIFKKKDSFVYGGTIANQKLIIKANVAIKDSTISNIVTHINDAKEAKPKAQKISDKIAGWLIPAVLLISFLTLIFYFTILKASANTSFVVFITILVVACPMSFAMITPMCILVANTSSAKRNIILNSKMVFENISNIDIIAFDKTGTLTTGNFLVVESNLNKKQISLVVAAESKIKHPIAQSIVEHYKNLKDINTKELTIDFIEGNGLKIKKNKDLYYLGSLTFVNKYFKFKEEEKLEKKRENGGLILYLFDQDKVIGYLLLKDEIKEEAYSVINYLKSKKITPYLITGDNKLNAKYVADQLGILDQHLFYQILPQDKYKIIKELQDTGKKVIFVGDGINDSIALQQSDVGISMGSASDLAIQSSDITIQNNNLKKIPLAISFSKATIHTIYFAFLVAILYNLVIIPLAMTNNLTPAIGATSMALNEIMAIIIALSLKRLKYKKEIP